MPASSRSSSRRKLLATFLGAAGPLAGCAVDRADPSVLAEEFLTRYVVRSDQAAALELADQHARTLLEEELREVRELRAAGASTERPEEDRPSFLLIESLREAPDSRRMLYQIDAAGESSGRIVLHLGREGEQWSVTSFSFAGE